MLLVQTERNSATDDDLKLRHRQALKAEYPMLGLVRDAFPYRIPGPRFGHYGSLVMVAPCNMACPYCDVGGYAKDENHNLPGWKMISLSEIEEFVDQEVARGRIIYLTGGEPLMFPELGAHLGSRVREKGGYISVCTNATARNRLLELSKYVDEFSISLKGTAKTAEITAGVRGRLAFDLPHFNTLALLDVPGVAVELVVVLFDSLDLAEFKQIYGPFVGRAYLTLKQYRPKVTTVREDRSYETVLLSEDEQRALRPMSLERAQSLFADLMKLYGPYGEYFTLVTGGGGNQRVVRGDGAHLFER